MAETLARRSVVLDHPISPAQLRTALRGVPADASVVIEPSGRMVVAGREVPAAVVLVAVWHQRFRMVTVGEQLQLYRDYDEL